MVRKIFLTFFISYSFCSYSQSLINAIVKDSKTKEPLGFCNIAIKGTNKGTITNLDGVFSLSVDQTKDIITISYLGYENKTIKAEELVKKTEILLIKKAFILQEVSVHADNEYLYDIMVKCRKKLIENKTKTIARVYYGLESDAKTLSVWYPDKNGDTLKYFKLDSINNVEKPVELLECFYNATVNGTTIKELEFKNGRTALAAIENYFMTYGSSKAFSKIVLTEENDGFPALPFQFGKSSLEKLFDLELLYYDGSSYNIKFSPRNEFSKYFAGEVWIEKETFNLLKVHFKIKNANIHPFLPNFPNDSIKNVSMDIANTYKTEDNKVLPDHIFFNYSFSYFSRKDSAFLYYKNMDRVIQSKGILYFYDYDYPFILPYFDYVDDTQYDDYHKMSFIPYNEDFWNNNGTLLLTKKQREEFDLLVNDGQLINFRENNYGDDFLSRTSMPGNIGRFEFFYAFWSSCKRIVPNPSSPQFETYSKDKINQNIKTDLYKLKVQILLDIVEANDSLLCKSYTVFDNYQSYYHLPIDSNTNAFLNIFFDICEIERMKMQNKLNSKNYTASEIDSIYKETMTNMDNLTNRYLKEVNVGENDKFFRQWNKYVFDNLSIDNIKMVEESNK